MVDGFISPEGPQPRVPFSHEIAAVNTQPVVPIDLPRRPPHFQPFDPRRSPQAEVESRISGRLVAAAADPLRDWRRPPASSSTRAPTPSRFERTPSQPRASPSGRLRLVWLWKIDERLILRQDDGVDPAVVVEVADGQAAAQVERLERRPGSGRRVGQPAARPADEQLDRHLPGEGGP